MSTKNQKLTDEQKLDIALATQYVRLDLNELDNGAAEAEAAKVSNVPVARVREAVARIQHDANHPYWISKK